MAKPKGWVISTAKSPKPLMPDSVKAELEAKASDLIENVLKPKHVLPPKNDEPFNYISDITTKVVQELLLLRHHLRLSGAECPLALVRVEVCTDGIRRWRQVRPQLHASQRRMGWVVRFSLRGRVPESHPRRCVVCAVTPLRDDPRNRSGSPRLAVRPTGREPDERQRSKA